MSSVQKELGYATICRSEFKLQIPGDTRLYEPVYDFIDLELPRGQIIGHIVDMKGEPNLIIVRIVEVTKVGKSLRVESVKTIPILHNGDTRSLDELAVAEWTIKRDEIACIFDPV